MSVNRKKDGRWYCAYHEQATNRPVFEYFGRGLEAEKQARLPDLEIKRLRIEAPRRLHGDAIPFQTLAQEYVNARQVELSPGTIDDILRTVVLYALPIIGAIPINRVTMSDWTRIEAVMIARKVKARTINSISSMSRGYSPGASNGNT